MGPFFVVDILANWVQPFLAMKNTPSTVRSLTLKDVQQLPARNWDYNPDAFDSVVLIRDGRDHESGYGSLTIVGCRAGVPVVRCSVGVDDVTWAFEFNTPLRTECLPGSGALHFYSAESKVRFAVSAPGVSSVTIKVFLNSLRD